MVEGMLEAGAEVAMIGASSKSVELAEEYTANGWKAYGLQCDLSDRDSVKAGFDIALKLLGGDIDVLVNAAGIQRRHKSEEFPIQDWEAVLEVNLTVPFVLCQFAGRRMIEQGRGGKIINFASMLSFFGGYTVPAYAASKGGIAQMTKALCNEWAKYGINVNAVAPGFVQTDMTKGLDAGRWGTPDDVKGIGIFLASAASDYINGAVIPCDGGYLVK